MLEFLHLSPLHQAVVMFLFGLFGRVIGLSTPATLVSCFLAWFAFDTPYRELMEVALIGNRIHLFMEMAADTGAPPREEGEDYL